MSKLLVEGGRKLSGQLSVHGAKNSVLPILAATLLSERSVIHNCPDLSDVAAARNILQYLGCQTERNGSTLTVTTSDMCCCEIPDALMREMRSSVVFLGAILSKCGEARVSLPGGCELGARPIDIHLTSLQRLGVQIEEDHGYLNCTIPGKLKGCNITLPFPSVGATENIMLAACMAEGNTVINNAAREPEIADLGNFLNACGANIKFDDFGSIYITGVKKLHPAEHRVIPDRIATATYLCCAAVTGGEIEILRTNPAHIASILPLLEESGCRLTTTEQGIYLVAPKRLSAIKSVRTMPYPGFPTDAQSPIMALMCTAQGMSMFIENIFENRYKQVPQLIRMGADIKLEGRVAVVQGVEHLHSAEVECTDLRGGASLVVAALAANGMTTIDNIKHIERGYEKIEDALNALGAAITRIEE